MKTIVVKFGGSSLASAAQFRKVGDILRADPARRFLVVSAPGKRDSGDTKVTDMLYRCYDLAVAGEDFAPVLEAVRARYGEIAEGLGVKFDLDGALADLPGFGGLHPLPRRRRPGPGHHLSAAGRGHGEDGKSGAARLLRRR